MYLQLHVVNDATKLALLTAEVEKYQTEKVPRLKCITSIDCD